MTKHGVLPKDIDANVFDVPDECPLCHHAIQPIYVTHYPTGHDAVLHDRFQIVFACPRGDCGFVFVGYYSQNRSKQELRYTLPRAPTEPEVPALVAKVSPRFVEVYKQSEAAYSYHLQEVAGGGYRKALEVLVKDFLIAKDIKDEGTVAKLTFADAIKSLPSEVVKNLAHFTNKLGSDETHYYRKYESKDIDDLRELLDATVTALKLYLMHQDGKEEYGTPR